MVKLQVYDKFNSAKYKFRKFFFRNSQKKIALIRYRHPIPDAQAFPILSTTPSVIDFDGIDEFIEHIKLQNVDYDTVLIQCHWDTPSDWLKSKISEIRRLLLGVKVAFLDWYAPLHIPHADILDDIDFYIKKQSFCNIEEYSDMYDTKLNEYEAQWEPGFLKTKYLKTDIKKLSKKLIVGWNFATDMSRLNQLNLELYKKNNRNIDVHCRICAPNSRSDWYGHMRGRAFDAVQLLKEKHHVNFSILNESKSVAYPKYLRELSQSKLCFSPFGYGEVCWRDFEAIIGGALLLKPEMGHIQTNPNIYVPYETYVPIKWDFSDLEEQALKYLADENERKRITSNAVRVWRVFLDKGWEFLWSDILKKMSTAESSVTKLG